MAQIPLEDSFTDIIGKARRGLKLTDDAQLAQRAGVKPADAAAVAEGNLNEEALRSLAKALGLGEVTLVASAKKAWHPPALQLDGLAQFNTPFEDMTVNSYLAWDPSSHEAVAFDTGASCRPMLDLARDKGLKIKLILLTHTHRDHIVDLPALKSATRAPAYVCKLEPTDGAEAFAVGRGFECGRLKIETRQTSGHSPGGITYVVSGLAQPVAVVGDALFAGSMGGGMVSYADALANNRKNIFSLPDNTIICPGHGPLTTVGEEKQHNPFYPEFQKP